MTHTRIVVAPAIDFGAVRTEFALDDDYPLPAVAESEAAADRWSAARVDRTDLPLVTIDPPGSMDLDQALHLERTVDGFVLHYAIADVAWFVRAGDGFRLPAARGRVDELCLTDADPRPLGWRSYLLTRLADDWDVDGDAEVAWFELDHASDASRRLQTRPALALA